MTNQFKEKVANFTSSLAGGGEPEAPTTTTTSIKAIEPAPATAASSTAAATTAAPGCYAYSDRSQTSEKGMRQQIDPDTGLVYFKYDFGYEFGVVLPGEQQQQQEGLILAMSTDQQPTVGEDVSS